PPPSPPARPALAAVATLFLAAAVLAASGCAARDDQATAPASPVVAGDTAQAEPVTFGAPSTSAGDAEAACPPAAGASASPEGWPDLVGQWIAQDRDFAATGTGPSITFLADGTGFQSLLEGHWMPREFTWAIAGLPDGPSGRGYDGQVLISHAGHDGTPTCESWQFTFRQDSLDLFMWVPWADEIMAQRANIDLEPGMTISWADEPFEEFRLVSGAAVAECSASAPSPVHLEQFAAGTGHLDADQGLTVAVTEVGEWVSAPGGGPSYWAPGSPTVELLGVRVEADFRGSAHGLAGPGVWRIAAPFQLRTADGQLASCVLPDGERHAIYLAAIGADRAFAGDGAGSQTASGWLICAAPTDALADFSADRTPFGAPSTRIEYARGYQLGMRGRLLCPSSFSMPLP
ncbi:MAG: hypothetical protein FWG11_09590, partial [Promicromonosporaceae bacterium]|nr:hypothetical protein [Promicromonosporaceae bacterium]